MVSSRPRLTKKRENKGREGSRIQAMQSVGGKKEEQLKPEIETTMQYQLFVNELDYLIAHIFLEESSCKSRTKSLKR